MSEEKVCSSEQIEVTSLTPGRRRPGSTLDYRFVKHVSQTPHRILVSDSRSAVTRRV